ncbi:MAG: alpha/beta hydrolase family protein [Kiritimatiellae bacterium]|nr:alpha/beta hydrolase family protein [Kiritimatiellia bacterium]MDD5519300.1 alpha/beta hydrolase family protein [Kiritimatiellia bacterium]
MKRREFMYLAGTAAALGAISRQTASVAGESTTSSLAVAGNTFVSGREDNRFIQTAGFLHKYLQTLQPRLAFRPDMSRQQFIDWQSTVRKKLMELMCFPEVPVQPEPKRIWAQPRDGYQLQRWELYPEPYSVVPFYLLVPDGVSQQSPAPAVLCFPGSTGSKEMLAGEPEQEGNPAPVKEKWNDNRMAYHYARRGIVAAVAENPATNELANTRGEKTPLPSSDAWRSRSVLSLVAIWMGRCYEAVSVFQKACLLQWLVKQPYVDAKRVATSGHSLGAKPADILGVLYPELIRAVVHNDFVCNWQERSVAMNLNDPGSQQVVPGIFQWFDYTDLEACLAPRPLLFTEGGRPNQIAKIHRAYELMGAADAMQLFHYDKYSDPKSRTLDSAELPVGISGEQYFRYAYVDAAEHRFRPNRAVPWLAKVFGI